MDEVVRNLEENFKAHFEASVRVTKKKSNSGNES